MYVLPLILANVCMLRIILKQKPVEFWSHMCVDFEYYNVISSHRCNEVQRPVLWGFRWHIMVPRYLQFTRLLLHCISHLLTLWQRVSCSRSMYHEIPEAEYLDWDVGKLRTLVISLPRNAKHLCSVFGTLQMLDIIAYTRPNLFERQLV